METTLEPKEALIWDLGNGVLSAGGGFGYLYFASWELWSFYLAALMMLSYGLFTIVNGIGSYADQPVATH